MTTVSSEQRKPSVGSAEWLVCGRCKSALSRLEPVLRRASFAGDLQLRVLAHYLIAQGGKRLRPALVFLGASYGEWVEDKLLLAAAAVEMMHVASLYHDDVMDRATLRRQVPSVNAQWGNSLATLGGTFLMARAMTYLGVLGNTPNQLASEASMDLAMGQLMEVENAYNLDLTELQHLEILRRKTSTLFELPLRLGAHLSGASKPHSDALVNYGRNLGLAFQLVDDALDLTSNSGALGKDAAADLREGVYSIAVLKALNKTDGLRGRLRAILRQVALSEEDISRVKCILEGSGAIDDALELATDFIRRAQAEIGGLPQGRPLDSLRLLAEFTLNRAS